VYLLKNYQEDRDQQKDEVVETMLLRILKKCLETADAQADKIAQQISPIPAGAQGVALFLHRCLTALLVAVLAILSGLLIG